jgi:uncharacterized protein YbjQ (UPF0145 family)
MEQQSLLNDRVIHLEFADIICCLANFGLPLFIFAVVFFIPMIAGRIIEKNHFQSLQQREEALKGKVLIHNRKRPTMSQPENSILVAGEVCIGADRFKTWLAKWRQLVGGKMGSLAPVVERARREATLRMIESAVEKGCKEVGNISFSTSHLKWTSKA